MMNFVLRCKQWWIWLLAAFIPLLMFGVAHPNYMKADTFFWVWLITLPLSAQFSKKSIGNWLMGLVIFFGVISLVMPTTFGSYFILGLILMILAEAAKIGVSITLFFHFLLASPLFVYISGLISFPLRIELSKITAYILYLVGFNAKADGNIIVFNGASFLVDKACSGLYMLGYGLLFGTIILSIKSKNRDIPIFKTLLLYTALVLLILVANVSRIGLLVIFNIPPGDWLHEGLGLFIYGFQVLFSFYWICHWINQKHQTINKVFNEFRPAFPALKYTLSLLFLLLIIVRKNNLSTSSHLPPQIEVVGFEKSDIGDGILKFKNENALLYIKPPVEPYRSDHNPLICWKGSGFEFKKIEILEVNGSKVNSGELIRDNHVLYTAWWFQSTANHTASNWTWRQNSLLNNERYHLVNVTCNSKEKLSHMLTMLMDADIFK